MLCTERRAKKSRYCSSRAKLGYRRPRFAKRSRHPNDGSRSSFAFLRFRRFFQQKKQCCEVRKPPILQKVTCWGTGAPDSLLPVNESSRHHNDDSRSWFAVHEINAFFSTRNICSAMYGNLRLSKKSRVFATRGVRNSQLLLFSG